MNSSEPLAQHCSAIIASEHAASRVDVAGLAGSAAATARGPQSTPDHGRNVENAPPDWAAAAGASQGNPRPAIRWRRTGLRASREGRLGAWAKSLGDRVEIRIRDNGTGIPPEVKEKMFNPFFTTKPAGEGTGIGLSISHDIIVKQHGGSIEVDNAARRVHRIQDPSAARGCDHRQIRRTQLSLLILVVDDESDVEVLFRQQFRRDLRAGRFSMEFAQSAPVALQRITDAGDRSLILILSDINMPGISGLELLPKARAMRPDVPIIMITAYGDAERPSARRWSRPQAGP